MHSLQDDIKIVKYIVFKGDKYFNGDYVEVEYDDNTYEKGFLEIYINSIDVKEISYDPHYHKLPKLMNSKITRITKL